MKTGLFLLACLVSSLEAFRPVAQAPFFSLDSTFGTGGKVQAVPTADSGSLNVLPTTNNKPITFCRFRAVTQLSNGSYLIGGVMTSDDNGWPAATQSRWALAKFTAAGALDNTFGALSTTAGGFLGLAYTDGTTKLNAVSTSVTTTLANEDADNAYISMGIFDMQTLANDVVVAVGTARSVSTAPAAAADRAQAAIIKVNAATNAASPAAFGSANGGVVYFDGNLSDGGSTTAAEARAVDVDAAGRIYVAGCAELLDNGTNSASDVRSRAMVFTSSADGSTTRQFAVNIPDTNGTLTSTRVACATAIKVLQSGLVAVAGYTYDIAGGSTMWVARFDPASNTATGQLVLDSTFGANGIAQIPVAGVVMVVGKILEQANGCLALVGSVRSNPGTFAAVGNYDQVTQATPLNNAAAVVLAQVASNGQSVLASRAVTLSGSSANATYGYSAQLQANGTLSVIGSYFDTNQQMFVANFDRRLRLINDSVVEIPATDPTNNIGAFGSSVDANGNFMLVGSRYDGEITAAGAVLVRVVPRSIGVIGALSQQLLQRLFIDGVTFIQAIE